MAIGKKQRALKYLAEMIWKKRLKRKDPNANDEKENWRRAKKLLKKLEKRYKKNV